MSAHRPLPRPLAPEPRALRLLALAARNFTLAGARPRTPVGARLGIIAGALCAALLAGCARSSTASHAVRLHIDGTDRTVATSAPSVRALLSELQVELGQLDLVEPPLWTPLDAGVAITVTRQWEETEERAVAYTTHTVRDEFLAPAASRVITPGVAGSELLTYRVTWDGPRRLGRELVRRDPIAAPVDELRLVGTQGTLPTIPFSGTIAYVANADAWVMHADSVHKRRLTDAGLLDGRVLALSPDGRTLLYTELLDDPDTPLNALRALDVQVLNARPVDTGLRGVLQVVWSPMGDSFVYTTAERTASIPGWRALNDLTRVRWPSLEASPLLPPAGALLYAWFGERWSWSPDGRWLAFARADSLGLLDPTDGQRRTLLEFAPAPVEGSQVWLPTLAWAQAGARLLATVPSAQSGVLHFDLLSIPVLDGAAATLRADVGRAAGVVASLEGDRAALLAAASAGAQPPVELLIVRDDVWSAAQPLPLPELCAAPSRPLAWAPEDDALLVLCAGDLLLARPTPADTVPLTASGLVSHAEWRP